MPRFNANIVTMFKEHDMLDRFAAAADCGFKGVELLFPYEWPMDELRRRMEAVELEMVLINTPPGDYANGERGFAGIPGAEERFREDFKRALEYAVALGSPRIHVMAGRIPADATAERCEAVFVENLKAAADLAGPEGVTLCLESLNNRDVPGYLILSPATVRRVIDQVGRPNLAFQYDAYHLQIMQGDLAETFRRYRDIVGHVQVSSLPGRHEPDGGEIHYPYLFAFLDAEGWDGWVGCEYSPRAGTKEGLAWAAAWGIG